MVSKRNLSEVLCPARFRAAWLGAQGSDLQKAHERVPEAALNTLGTLWSPSRAEGVKTGGWERLRKLVTEKPQSEKAATTHGRGCKQGDRAG